MRNIVRKFVRICTEELPVEEPIYEFGSFRVRKQEILANLRPLFEDKEYVGCDIREGRGVDEIINVCDTGLPDDSVGTILMLDTLEHIKYMWKACDECYRILKPGGILIVSVPFIYPIHNYPSDYWRVSPEGLKVLFEKFENCYVNFQIPKNKKNAFPRCVIGVGFKGDFPEGYKKFKKKIELWRK